jgi:hypothetical protein
MVNVVSKKCEHENCNKQPNFNNQMKLSEDFVTVIKNLI